MHNSTSFYEITLGDIVKNNKWFQVALDKFKANWYAYNRVEPIEIWGNLGFDIKDVTPNKQWKNKKWILSRSAACYFSFS